MNSYSVALVTTPWLSMAYPSIQLGVLTPVLSRAGIAVQPFSLNVDWLVYLREISQPGPPIVSFDDCEAVANDIRATGLGDWIFAEAACPGLRTADEYYRLLASLQVPEAFVDKARRLRAVVKPAIARWVDAVLSGNPLIVGISTTFSQNLASAALSAAIKRRAPGTAIVWGGANCDGTMGEALMRIFPSIDVTVQGEGEHVAVDVCRALLNGRPLDDIPGICTRGGDGRVVANRTVRAPVLMSAVPTPDYTEYFTRIEAGGLWGDLLHRVSIPIETSRGCWWGAKSHCTFCGLNRDSMAFRSKEPDRVVSELTELASRHKLDRFSAVDNIIDWTYLKTVLPRLTAVGHDWTLFYETKSNLKRDQLELYADAGIRIIQPGIESLSSGILKLMRKGVTALQNIALLKWATAYGIQVNWNIIVGTPGEPPEEYERMAELVESLWHLQPPSLSRLSLDRFSPYQQNPRMWGLSITGPMEFYRHIYDVDDRELMDLAYRFEFSYDDGRRPQEYSAPLRAAIDQWHQRFPQSAGQLRYSRGPDFLRIRDYRRAEAPLEFVLNTTESILYLSCDEPATAQHAWLSLPATTRRTYNQESAEAFLAELVRLRLMHEEGGRFLGLALPSSPRHRREVDSPSSAGHKLPAADVSGALDGNRGGTIASQPRSSATLWQVTFALRSDVWPPGGGFM
jgi:ribosomal peptide maturation radical SAM protein 1